MTANNRNQFFLKEPFVFLIIGLVLINFLGVSIYWCYLLIPIFIFHLSNNFDLVGRNFIFITAFSILYTAALIINKSDDSTSLLFGYLLFPPVFYFLGIYLVKKYPQVHNVISLLLITTTLFCILPFAANIISVSENGFMTQRDIALFWIKDYETIKATIVGSYFALNLSLLPIILIKEDIRGKGFIRFTSLLLLASSVFATLNMSNRTGLLILVSSLFVFIFVTKYKLSSGLIVILLLLIGALLFVNDLFGMRTWFESTSYFERISSTSLRDENTRIILWERALERLANNPTGEINYDIKAEYAHNLWLDSGLKGGLIPMLSLVLTFILASQSIIKVVFNFSYNEHLRWIIAGFGLGFFITFMVEPILNGFYIMFFVFFFYFGIVDGVIKYLRPLNS